MPGQRKKILVVDDDHAIRRLVATVARKSGYATSEASDGAHALEIMEEETFDLLILDLMLPRVSGHEVLERLDPGRGCAVIILTAAGDHDLEELDSRLICAIIRKPFDIFDLEKSIVAALESGSATEIVS
ncbi:MAG: response regulator [Acidobacteria bacterium]|nr:response regulator [Acidobacteriota bacterium]